MTDAGSVAIACFRGPLSSVVTRGGYAIVAVDVIRTMTTAVTAAALGRRVFPAPTAGSSRRGRTRCICRVFPCPPGTSLPGISGSSCWRWRSPRRPGRRAGFPFPKPSVPA
ncbi:MAG: hypothetical protein DMD69_14915 [Gemmatimonadetes bacterium]|nr:MAG: hypothetical protein DMD69_14915 [Gemmatimonadota bacterium]